MCRGRHTSPCPHKAQSRTLRAFQRPLLLGLPWLTTGRPRATTLARGTVGPLARPAPAWKAPATHCLLSQRSNCDCTWSPAPCPFAMHHASWCSLLLGATRDGCFLDRTSVCEPPHLCHSPKRRAHNWPAGLRTSDCLPLGSPQGRTGTAGLVPGGPPCLWCCHLSWVCLCPSACWKCPPLRLWECPPWFQHLPCPGDNVQLSCLLFRPSGMAPWAALGHGLCPCWGHMSPCREQGPGKAAETTLAHRHLAHSRPVLWVSQTGD